MARRTTAHAAACAAAAAVRGKGGGLTWCSRWLRRARNAALRWRAFQLSPLA